MSLTEVRENNEAVITAISGDTRFMSRITSIGLTPGCKVSVIKNDNRKECSGITVEEVTA